MAIVGRKNSLSNGKQTRTRLREGQPFAANSLGEGRKTGKRLITKCRAAYKQIVRKMSEEEDLC